MVSPETTLVQLLRNRRAELGDAPAFGYLVQGEGELAELTYAALDAESRRIAVSLLERVEPGDRVLLVHPPGLDFVTAFFGCLYAGVVAVPTYPPDPTRPERSVPRLLHIVRDAEARVALGTGTSLPALRDVAAAGSRDAGPPLEWLASDSPDAGDSGRWVAPPVDAKSVACIQYTSGSESQPKGVVLSHENLLSNLRLIHERFALGERDVGVFWLPSYHDMGLIGGILGPVFAGRCGYLMSPLHFLERPIRWLRAISRFRATVSGGPNFAYELCTRRTTEAEREGLDLGSWAVAFTGAEPVRAETLERFTRAFEPHGFQRRAFTPCYGLAEATLMVTSGSRGAGARVERVERVALAQGRIVPAAQGEDAAELVGCGSAGADAKLLVVDPTTRKPLGPREVGEIWFRGPGVARRYWRASDAESDDALHTAASAEIGGSFLHTGDLGALIDDELFVTGRIKDLIIVNGKNHYPQDLERTAEASHPAVRRGCSAAFSVEVGAAERVVLVSEPRPADTLDRVAVIRAVRDAVWREHAISLHAVVLVAPGSVPKTSSGKLQRGRCRDLFLAGALDVLEDGASGSADQAEHESNALEHRLAQRIAALTGVTADRIARDRPFDELGLDSVEIIALVADLEAELGRRVEQTAPWEHPTIASLAAHLSGVESPSEPAAAPSCDRAGVGPIAIVGIACRLPGAEGPRAFWDLLREGRSAVGPPPERCTRRGALDAALAQGVAELTGGFLDDVEGFDAVRFGVSPLEAARMDPQQRLILEAALDAVEDAGIARDALLETQTGVFIGISSFDYARLQLESGTRLDALAIAGNAHSIAANRISYFFGLRGPSVAVDTACSSSMVAVHLACNAIGNGECAAAIAGGVNVILAPEITLAFAAVGALASDGMCRPFDARASGTVRGEGVGAVLLKPLRAALRDGDRVYAVIRGSAVNSDGHRNGLLAPSLRAQVDVLRAAYRSAGVDPSDVDYVEGHGTGTPIGDAIELQALARVVGAGRSAARPCVIGSVKSSIGHLEAASGIAGLIKAALCLAHGEIPETANFAEPTRAVDLEAAGLRVADRRSSLRREAAPRLVGVSSFGFGGTNAHIVMESHEPADPARPAADGEAQILPLSSHHVDSLGRLVEAYRVQVRDDGSVGFADLCRAAALRRSHGAVRAAAVASSLEELGERLAALAERGAGGASAPARERSLTNGGKLAFCFSGHGSQWAGMGRGLWTREPVFRASVERVDRIARSLGAPTSIAERISAGTESSTLDDVADTQLALFAVQIGLARLWRSYGVTPDAVVGHSMGEAAASYVAGALPIEDATRVVFHRSRLMKEGIAVLLREGRSPGRMAAVELSLDEAREAVADEAEKVGIAANNGPRSVVLSGEPDALARVLERLRAQGVRGRELRTPGGGHNPLIEPLRPELERALEGIAPRAARVPFVSSVTGGWLRGDELGPAYWGRNLRDSVLFAPAVGQLLSAECRVFLEISPHPILALSIADCAGADAVSVLGSLRRDADERRELLSSAAALYRLGRELRWTELAPRSGRFVDLPRTPSVRRPHWVSAGQAAPAVSTGSGRAPLHRLLGVEHETEDPRERRWETTLKLEELPFVGDHRIEGVAVLPVGVYLELARVAAAEIFGAGACAIDDVRFQRPLSLWEDRPRRVRIVARLRGPDAAAIRIHGLEGTGGGRFGLHWQARVRRIAEVEGESTNAEIDALVQGCDGTASGPEAYARLESERGYSVGAAFRRVERFWWQRDRAVARIVAAASDEATAGPTNGGIDPVRLDACLQVVAAAAFGSELSQGSGGVSLPQSIGSVRVHGRLGDAAWSVARVRAARGGDSLHADVRIVDAAGKLVAELRDLRAARLAGRPASEDGSGDAPLLRVAWQELKLVTAPSDIEAAAGTATPRRWIVLAEGEIGRALAQRLEARGEICDRVELGVDFRRIAPRSWQIDPSAPDAYTRLWSELLSNETATRACVVHLWSLLATAGEAATADALGRTCQAACSDLLRLVRSLGARATTSSQRLWVCTRWAQAAGPARHPVEVAQAPIWGFVRAAALEHAELQPVLVDLDDAPAENIGDRLADELLVGGDEPQIAYRGELRLVPRLERFAEDGLEPADAGGSAAHRASYRRRVTPKDVLAGEVAIEVEAFEIDPRGLDVERAEGNSATPTFWLAACVGRVRAVGSGGRRRRKGEPVVALLPASLESVVTVPDVFVARCPDGVGTEEVAGLLFTFTLATRLLRGSVRTPRRRTLLISGRLGVLARAAAQVGGRFGFSVAGGVAAPAHRILFEESGVDAVIDADDPRVGATPEATLGAGAQIVLWDERLPKARSLARLLAPRARLYAIGEDPPELDAETLALFAARRVVFREVRPRAFLAERPFETRAALADVMRAIAAGELRAARAVRFSIDDVAAARRKAADDEEGRPVVVTVLSRERTSTAALRADATYLVTGGLGGLGLAAAEWMVERGARHLVLLGRTGASSVEQRAAVRRLRDLGAQVRVRRADVSDGAALARVLAEIRRKAFALRGVVHAAGVVTEGGLIAHLDPEVFARLASAKVMGSWNLHLQTLAEDLDFFVLFSSAAALLGAPGNSVYCAANAFLDGLAQHRRSRGLPALAIDWGPWARVGRILESDADGAVRALASFGVRALAPERALGALERCLGSDAEQVAVLDADWRRLSAQAGPGPMARLLASLAGPETSREAGPPTQGLTRDAVLALPPSERVSALQAFLMREIAERLGVRAGELDPSLPLDALGLDSLHAVELKHELEWRLRTQLPVVLLLEGPTLAELAGHLVERLEAGSLPEAVIAPRRRPESASEEAPASLAQERRWERERSQPGSTDPVIAVGIRLRGPASLDALERALTELVRRHEALRTALPERDGRPVQRILPPGPAALEVVHLSDVPEEGRFARARAIAGEWAEKPFAIETGPLFRVGLVCMEPADHLLAIVVHHIVFDGWSARIVMREFAVLYRDFAEGRPSSLPPPQLQFGDYAFWQRSALAPARLADLRSHWGGILSRELPTLALPMRSSSREKKTFAAGTRPMFLAPERIRDVRELGRRMHATPFMVLLACFDALLSACTRQDDVVVASPHFNRDRLETKDLVGWLNNVLVLRTDMSGDPSFEELVARVRRVCLDAFEYQDMPFSLLVESHPKAGDLQVSCGLQELAVEKLELPDLTVEMMPLSRRRAAFDLVLGFIDTGASLFGIWEYSEELFDAGVIDRLRDEYLAVLSAVGADPSVRLSALRGLVTELAVSGAGDVAACG